MDTEKLMQHWTPCSCRRGRAKLVDDSGEHKCNVTYDEMLEDSRRADVKRKLEATDD